MANRVKLGFLLIAYLSVSVLPTQAAKLVDQDEPEFVSIRLLPIGSADKRRQLWHELNTIAKPTILRVPSGETLAEAIRKQCGSAPGDLIDFASSLNPGTDLGPTKDNRDLQFIPCPYWSFKEQPQPPSIRVTKGEQLQKILPFYMGTSGIETVTDVKVLNPRLVDSNGNVTTDGRLVLPYVSGGTLFELRPQYQALPRNTLGWWGSDTSRWSGTPAYGVPGGDTWWRGALPGGDMLSGDMSKWSGKPGGGVPGSVTCAAAGYSTWRGDTLYGGVNSAAIRYAAPMVAKSLTSAGREAYRLVGEDGPDFSDPRKECEGPPDDTAWPVDMARVLASFQTTLQSLKAKPTDKAVALIVDTGLDISDSIIKTSLWVHKDVANNVRVRGAYYEGDLHGANMITGMGDIEPTPGYKFAFHGTEVSRIFLGPSYQLVSQFSMVAAAKVNEDQDPYKITLNSIPDSLKYAREIGAAVLNVSVVIARKTPWLEEGLNAANFLVIAAAGNNSGFLDQHPLYPPAISTSRDHLLVVGAHDWKNRIAAFSNRGTLVDLLAPGCAIPVIGADGTVALLSGTSFSAPFVTLTATLLAHIGLRGFDLKNRILASVDFDPGLVKVVKYAGRLNMEKAVRIRDDAITTESVGHPVIFGQIEEDPTWICTIGGAERAFNPTQVLKIIPRYPISNSTTAPVVWVRSGDNGALQELICDGDLSGSVSFKAIGKAKSTTYQWSELTEVVPRHRPN